MQRYEKFSILMQQIYRFFTFNTLTLWYRHKKNRPTNCQAIDFCFEAV